GQTLVPPCFPYRLDGEDGVLELFAPGKEGSQIGAEHLSMAERSDPNCLLGVSRPWDTNAVDSVHRANSRVLFHLLHGWDLNGGGWRIAIDAEKRHHLVLYDLEGATGTDSWDPWSSKKYEVAELERIGRDFFDHLVSISDETLLECGGAWA